MKAEPIFVTEATAAQLMDMKPAEFRKLVEAGHLPRPCEIAPGMVRWQVDDLRKIASGAAILGGDMQW